MEINAVEIGCRIRNLRESKKYSREKFCELVGISSKFLYEIENGKKGFSAFVLCGMAQVCGVSSDYILWGTKNSNPNFAKMFEMFKEEDINDIVTILHCILKIKSRR